MCCCNFSANPQFEFGCDIKKRSRPSKTQERLCFLLHGRQMPPSQLETGKLARFKKHNHLRTCSKCREIGMWPYCQLAKDKWRPQICGFTVFMGAEGWFIINTCFCLSLQSFDGSMMDMNMDTDLELLIRAGRKWSKCFAGALWWRLKPMLVRKIPLKQPLRAEAHTF